MSRIIQVRDVPEESYQALKARAKREGVSMADLLRRELAGIAERPSRTEILDRIAQRNIVPEAEDPVVAVRRARDAK